jgi:CubicO group peptidase (beta-lactamase class C family)
MRSLLTRLGHYSLAGALIAFALATALVAQATRIEDRLPRFVNREKTDATSRADWLNPPDTPFPLPAASSAGAFTVSYQHQGKTLTLDDYFKRTDVLGFLVLKDGRVVLERYFHATGAADRYLSMSVSKSLVAVLFGVAVDEGRIASIDDPVVKYLPKLQNGGYRDVTIRNVLNMATGIQFSEEYGVSSSGVGQLSAANRTGSPSFEDFAAALPSEKAPGKTFTYQSVNTQVLAEVLEAATGVPLNVYAESKLWKKIGAESRAYFLTGKDQPGICAYGCFYATLRDYARFGLMAMRGGILTKDRVVSEKWIKESGSPAPFAQPSVDPKTGQCRRGYGFQWWVPCGADDAFQAVGINGQAIYVNPPKRIVIAQFSSWPQASASPEIRGEGATVFDAIVARLSN